MLRVPVSLFLLVFTLLWSSIGLATETFSADGPTDATLSLTDMQTARRHKALLANGVAAGGILVWGLLNWDYFSRTPQTKNEGWFERTSIEGGADKLGHLWFSYTLSHAFAAWYRHIGYSEEEAAIFGPISSIGLTGLMEVGDSFSVDHGFSWQDMTANLAGATVGWLLLRYPDWQRKVDLRWDYRPSLSDPETDISTDYEHSRYLLALKAEGFEALRRPGLDYLELHLGYYARGYADYRPGLPDSRRRTLYVGVGLNVGKLLRPLWNTRLFDYLQVPYTDLPIHLRLD
ncbi:MAG: DUF2279 domain-containing protein [Deltaproteobacteria bacterium]|nr:MAG: DUF2279 domain-containing protein [Deltaproteobacteria bacterium]